MQSRIDRPARQRSVGQTLVLGLLLACSAGVARAQAALPDPVTDSWTGWFEENPAGDIVPPGELPPQGPARTTVGPLTFYTDAALFDADFPGLPLEDFEESPVPPFGVTGCDEPVDESSSDACFSPGDIEPGFAVRTFEGIRSGCPIECPMVVLGDGVIGQTDVITGANFFADTVLLEATEDACALGFFVHVPVNETFDVTVTTQSGAFPTTAAASTTGLFWGVATVGDPILSVHLSSPSGAGELLDNVRLGVNTCSVADVSATKVDLPGTPAMPGDTITYQVDLSNAGPDPATDVELDDTPDPNTTLAGGATTTPLALDDGLYEGDPTTPTTVDGTLQPLLLDNDFGIPGTPTLAAIPVVGQPTTLLGSVDINADGSFTYTPPAGATGGETDTFTYDVQNGIPPSSPATDTATASILLGLPPVAQDDALSVVQGTSTLLDAAADNGSGADDFGVPTGAVDGYSEVGGALGTTPGNDFFSTVSGNRINFDVSGDGTFTYDATVNAAFSGIDTFEYRITNSVGSDTAVVTITVQAPPIAVDDAPDMLSAPGDAYHTALNTTLNSTAHASPPVLDNDDRGFPLADVVSYGTSGSPTDQTVPGAPTATDNGGTVVVSADGNFVYTPPGPTFTGPDFFGYRIDNGAGSDDGVVTIAVGLRPACDDEVDPDDYDALGNVGITVPDASGVLIGDTGDQITVTGNTAPVSGGTATVAAGGGFTYTSGAGFGGTDDTFTYTVGNGFGDSAACTVEITVGSTIWFIDNEAGGGGNGTLSAPYDSLSAYATPALDDAGDIVFIDAGDGTSIDYDTGITLKNSQLLIGQGVDLATVSGVTLPPFSDPLPGVATNPIITNTAGAGITLANANLATGLDVDNATGAAITGTNTAGLTILQVGIDTSGGQGLIFNTPTGTIDIDGAVISGTTGNGVDINGGSASFDFDTACSITNPAGTAFRIDGGSVSVVFNGSISQANNAATVSVNNHSTGTVTFQNGTIGATNGTGLQFSNADGAAYNFNGTTTLNGGDAGIDILGGSFAQFTFGTGTSITSPSGVAFNVDGDTDETVFSGSITQTVNNSAAVEITNHSSGGSNPITFDASSTINATTGTGLQLSNADRVYNFNGTVTLNGGDAGIDILGASAGTFTFGSNVSVTSPTGTALNIASSSGFVNFDGGITQASNATAIAMTNDVSDLTMGAGSTVNATNGDGLQFSDADGINSFNGTVTLNGGDAGIDILADSSGTFTFANTTITSPANGAFNVDTSSPGITYSGGSIAQSSAATAYRANGNTGGTQNIGVAITANTSTATGISLTGNAGATINFTGALDVDTTTGQGFVATGGGRVTTNAGVTNTVNTTTGRGVNIANTTIGATHVTFASITVGAAPNAILLDTTGSNDFTVTGTTSATGVNGNAVQCKTVAGDVTLATLAINGTTVTSTQTFTDAPGGDVRFLPDANGDGDGIFLDGVTGTFAANGGTIQDVGDNALDVFNSSDVTLSGVTISDGGDANSFSTVNSAVQATTSSNIDLIDVSISNFGNEVAAGSTIRESALAYRDVSGTALIQRTTIDTGTGFVFERFAQLPENLGLELENRNVDLVVTVTGSTFRNIDFEGIQARHLDGDLTLTVDGGTADGANTFEFINGAAINFGQTAADTGVSDGVFYLGDTNLTDIGIGSRVGLLNTADVTLNFVGNVVTRTFSDGFRIRGFGGATSSDLTGTITGNTLDDVGLAISTIPAQNPGAGNGLEMLMESRTNSVVLFDDNTIDDVVDNAGSIGINVANNSLSDMDLVFTNNFVRGITADMVGGDPETDFQLITTGSAVGAATTCLALTGNDMTPTSPAGSFGVTYDFKFDIGIDGMGSSLTLEDYATPAADICSGFGLLANPEQFIDANNTTDQICAVIDQFGIGLTTVDPAPGGANLCTRPPALTALIVLGDDRVAAGGTLRLLAERDGEPIAGVPVRFTAVPFGAVTAFFPAGRIAYSDEDGVVSLPIESNGKAGSYTIRADAIPATGAPQSFNVTNH